MITTNSNTIRYSLVTNTDLDNRLKSFLHSRSLNSFILEAIEEKLQRESRLQALEKLNQLPPTFLEIEDPAQYIHDLRKADDEHRSSKIHPHE